MAEANSEPIIQLDPYGKYLLWQREKYSLGQGSFGKVYKAAKISTSQVFAAKAITEKGDHMKETIPMNLKHCNVLKLIDIYSVDGRYWLLMEYCDRNLMAFLQNEADYPGDVTQIYISMQCIEAVKYLHSKKIVHRDIKPANILLITRESTIMPVVRLADFSLAKCMEKSSLYTGAGTPRWMAPELLDQQGHRIANPDKYTRLVDVFSVALVCLYIFISKRGKDFLLRETVGAKLKNSTNYIRFGVDSFWRNRQMKTKLSTLVYNMLDAEARQRPSAADASLIIAKIFPKEKRNLNENLIEDPTRVQDEEFCATLKTELDRVGPSTKMSTMSISKAGTSGTSVTMIEGTTEDRPSHAGLGDSTLGDGTLSLKIPEGAAYPTTGPPLPSPSYSQQRGEHMEKILNQLGISKHHQISLHQVKSIKGEYKDQQEEIRWGDLPISMLEKLIMMDYRTRDNEISRCASSNTQTMSNQQKRRSAKDLLARLSADYRETEEYKNPLDIFVAIFNQCTPELKQVICKKMFECNLALPFIIPNTKGNGMTISLWSLETIFMEWRNRDQKICEESFARHPMHSVAFIRLGKTHVSKSILLNKIISETSSHSVHCNHECPNGNQPRFIANGMVELSCYLPTGKETDTFKDELFFLNLRGNGTKSPKMVDYLCEMSCITIFMLDIHNIQAIEKELHAIISQKRYKKVGFFLTSKNSPDDVSIANTLKNLSNICGNEQDEVLYFTSFQIPYKENLKSFDEMREELQGDICDIIDSCQYKNSISDHSYSVYERHGAQLGEEEFQGIHLDEKEIIGCQDGKQLAETLIDDANKLMTMGNREKNVPLQGEAWKKWCDLKKEKYRKKDMDTKEKIDKEMNRLLEMQRSKSSQLPPIMKGLIHNMSKLIEDDQTQNMMFFNTWLKIFFNDLSMKTILELHREHRMAWEEHHSLREITDVDEKRMKELEKKLERLEIKITNSSFGYEHLMRELGQLYEAFANMQGYHQEWQQKWKWRDKWLILPDIAASLLLTGNPFEIMDGDTSNVSLTWVKEVFSSVKDKIGNKSLFIISIIGIQSSGKSTLLNAMFGLDFNVSAGRCTKGIYAQLLSVQDRADLPFEYLLVLDSEGLRAPELANNKYDHDNELATLLIGLADITIVNLKGENTAEMRDILEIVVLAFLRMKLADKYKCQRAIFVHQNVSSLSANERMGVSVKTLTDRLDTLTREAAKAEKKASKISLFSHVIEFNGQRDVWYFPDLWLGNPPMATVNPAYSDKAKIVRRAILNRFKTEFSESKTPLSIDNFIVRLEDIWTAILTDDFVFCFRNTTAMKAQVQMNKRIAVLKHTLEKEAKDMKNSLLIQLNKCDNVHDLNDQFDYAVGTCKRKISEFYERKRDDLEDFFNQTEFKEVLEEKREDRLTDLNLTMDNILRQTESSIHYFRRMRQTILEQRADMVDQKDILLEKIDIIAKQYSGKYSNEDVHKKFEEVWLTVTTEEDDQKTTREIMEDTLIREINKDNTKMHLAHVIILLRQRRELNSLFRCIEKEDIESDCYTWKSWLVWGRKDHAEEVMCHVRMILQEVNSQIYDAIKAGIDDVNRNGRQFVKTVLDKLSSKDHKDFFFTPKGKAKLAALIVNFAIDEFEKHFKLEKVTEVAKFITSSMEQSLLTEFEIEGAKMYVDLRPLQNIYREVHPVLSYHKCLNDDGIIDMHKRGCFDWILQALHSKLLSYDHPLSNFDQAHGNDFVKEIFKQLDIHDKGSFFCRKPFEIRQKATIAILAVCHAMPYFEAMTVRYEHTCGGKVDLEKFKAEMRTKFISKVNEHGDIVEVADLFCDVIKQEMKQEIQVFVTKRLEEDFLNLYENSKHTLLSRVYRELANVNDFEYFTEYLESPRGFCCRYVHQQFEEYAFQKQTEEDDHLYSMIASERLNQLIASVLKCVMEAAKPKVKGSNSPPLSTWIKLFCRKIKYQSSEFILAEKDLKSLRGKDVSNTERLAQQIEVNLGLVDDLKVQFQSVSKYNVKWGHHLPYDSIFSRLWGCHRVCPFCKEPCIQTADRHPGRHQCLQHRVHGLNGWKPEVRNTLSLRYCPQAVTSVTDIYYCNKKTCSCGAYGKKRVTHYYKDYKINESSWDIPPDSSGNSSTFWKWVFCRYSDKFAQKYGCEGCAIPQSWKNITHEKAMESLSYFRG